MGDAEALDGGGRNAAGEKHAADEKGYRREDGLEGKGAEPEFPDDGQHAQARAAGSGQPHKEVLPGRGDFLVEHDVEPGQPEGPAEGVEEGKRPEEVGEGPDESVGGRPEVQEEGRGDAEADEVGKGIEFGAQARGRAQQAGQPAVDPVEEAGDQDEDGRPRPLPGAGEPDGGDAAGGGHAGGQVRHEVAEGEGMAGGVFAAAVFHGQWRGRRVDGWSRSVRSFRGDGRGWFRRRPWSGRGRRRASRRAGGRRRGGIRSG